MSTNSVSRGADDFRAASGLGRWPLSPADLEADDSPAPPRGPGLFEVARDGGEPVTTNVRRVAGNERPPGSVLIAVSAGLLALLGAGCFYVSWWGQYLFIFAAKQQAIPAQIQAGMLDAGMVILSGLSLGLAWQGKPSRAERVLIQLCAAGSAAMNYLAADDASPRSVIVFTAAPVFAAIITDRVVSVVRRHALGISEESAWRGLGRAVLGLARVTGMIALYWLRFALAPKETAGGVRRMVLNAAPLPGGPERPELPAAEEVPAIGPPGIEPAPTKKAVLLKLYRAHADYGDRGKASKVAAELAPQAGLQAGSARSYVYAEISGRAS
jgi:hypothetical protein